MDRTKNIPLQWLFLAFVASIYISISVYEAFIIILLALFLYRFHVSEKKRLIGYFTIPVLLFIAGMIVPTLLFASHSRYADQGFARAVFACIYFPALAAYNNDETLLKRYSLIIVAGGILWAVAAYVKYFAFKIPSAHGLWGSAFEFGNLVSLSSLVVLGIVVGACRDRPFKRVLYLALFFFMTGALALTFERTTWLGILFGVLFLFYLSFDKTGVRKSFLVFSGIGILVIITLSVYFFARHDPRYIALKDIVMKRQTTTANFNTLSSDRWYKLEASVKIIQSDIDQKRYLNLVFGHGFRAGASIKNINYGKTPVTTSFESISFLAEYIDTGILGIAYMLLIYIYFLKQLIALKRIRIEDKTVLFMVYGIMAGTGGYLFGSLFNMFVTSTFFFYLFLFGTVEQYVRRKGSAPSSESSKN